MARFYRSVDGRPVRRELWRSELARIERTLHSFFETQCIHRHKWWANCMHQHSNFPYWTTWINIHVFWMKLKSDRKNAIVLLLLLNTIVWSNWQSSHIVSSVKCLSENRGKSKWSVLGCFSQNNGTWSLCLAEH